MKCPECGKNIGRFLPDEWPECPFCEWSGVPKPYKRLTANEIWGEDALEDFRTVQGDVHEVRRRS